MELVRKNSSKYQDILSSVITFLFSSLGWSQLIFIAPLQRVIGNSEEEECLKAKIVKGKYGPKLEFQRGQRFKPKKTPVGEYGYFLEQHLECLNKC